MDNILFVHMLDALTDLSHVIYDLCFGHGVTFGRDPFE